MKIQLDDIIQEYKRLHKKTVTPYDNLPKEELEKINLELKLREEEARRYKEAIQKYHQYKNSYPVLQDVRTFAIRRIVHSRSTINDILAVDREEKESGIDEKMLDRTNQRKRTAYREREKTDAEVGRRGD